MLKLFYYILFMCTDTATTKIHTLSLHDALPISRTAWQPSPNGFAGPTRGGSRSSWLTCRTGARPRSYAMKSPRSEEHTSELQSQSNLVCRLLLEKKNKRHPRAADSARTNQTHSR